MKSPVARRSVLSNGHKTSVSLEEPFWSSMKEISQERGMTLSELVSEIDANRQQGNLSSAIRLFVLDHFKTRAGEMSRGKPIPFDPVNKATSSCSASTVDGSLRSRWVSDLQRSECFGCPSRAMLHSSLAHSVRRAPASAETTLSHQTTAACRVVSPKRMQLARSESRLA